MEENRSDYITLKPMKNNCVCVINMPMSKITIICYIINMCFLYINLQRETYKCHIINLDVKVYFPK